jgi:cholesterol transport system auxiliary component
MSRKLKAVLPVLTAVIALAACVSGLNTKVPARQSYTLQGVSAPADGPGAAAAAPEGPPAASSIEVLAPSAAPGLGRADIVVLRPGERLDFYANARWAAAAPVMLQSLVIDRLRAANRFASVESDTGPFSAQYVLSLELQHFEAVYEAAGAPTVRVALVCTLGRRTDRNVVASFTVRSEVRADADRMEAVVAAFDEATGRVLEQLAAEVVPPVS